MNDLEKLALIINNAFNKLYEKIDSLSKEIKNTPAPQVTVNHPDVNVNVPEVIVPQINIPEVKIPPFPKFPEIPPIKVPQPIVNIEKSDPPIVNIPAPIVNVPPANIKIEPKIDFPRKMQVEGMDELFEGFKKDTSSLKNIDSKKPLAVMVIDRKGNRISEFGGDFSAPSLVGLKNNATQQVQINPATEDTLSSLLTELYINNGGMAMQVDDVTGTIYQGWAQPGTLTSASSWRIRKIVDTGSPTDTAITFADGNRNFDNIWNNRLALSYS